MLKKDHLLTGVLAALVFPALAWATGYWLMDTAYIINRPLVPYFIAIGLNLILMRLSLRWALNNTAKGIMLATFVFMVLVLIFKIHPFR